MLDRIVNNRKLQILEKAMDAAALRHEVLANNIANVNTPGFKRSDVSFERELQTVLGQQTTFRAKTSSPRHFQFAAGSLAELKPRLIQENRTVFRNDGNNVDIDAEMAEMTENTVLYSVLSQQVLKEFNSLKQVIKGGR